MIRQRAALFLVLLACPGFALADSELDGSARFDLRGGNVSGFALDDGEGGGSAAGSRLRLGGTWHTAPGLSLNGEIDALFLNLYGAMPELDPDGWTKPYAGFGNETVRTDLRKLYLTWDTWVGSLRAGLQTSHWGLGLIANDGDKGSFWGAPRHGDLVWRGLFATKPFIWFTGADWAQNFYAAVGFDYVWRDENADALQGDRAMQGVFSFFWRQEEMVKEAGIYIARRMQKDRADAVGLEAELNVTAIDLFGAWSLDVASGIPWQTRAEFLFLTGETSRLRTEAAPNGVNVTGLGWVLHSAATVESLGLEVGLLAGYASGDNDSEDGKLTRTRFDPDFRPSLVLFETVLAHQSVRNQARASDPERSAVPQTGVQFLPTGGSVAGAWFVGPLVRWKAPMLEGLTLQVGLTSAEATADPVDPFATFQAGGAPTNLYGEPATERGLGVEVDLGVRYALSVTDDVTATVQGDLGMLNPGPAFTTATGRLDMVTAFYFGGHLTWRPE